MKRKLTGEITSTKMQKTVVVKVRALKENPKYRKRVFFDKKYKAHTDNANLKEGDKVMIEECAPRSKDKKWRVIAVL